MGRIAHAFYLLADLKGSIRSDPRRPRYFFIDPSIQSDSIARIQFSNLVFDLFGIHKKGPEGSAPNYSMYREVLDPWLLKSFCIFRVFAGPVEESRLASARSRVSMSNRRLKRLRCGWSSKLPGLTGIEPEWASELGEDFITLLSGELSGKRWLAHSGIALKDFSGYSIRHPSMAERAPLANFHKRWALTAKKR